MKLAIMGTLLGFLLIFQAVLSFLNVRLKRMKNEDSVDANSNDNAGDLSKSLPNNRNGKNLTCKKSLKPQFWLCNVQKKTKT